MLTHSASATVREAVIYGAPAPSALSVSSPVEEGLTFATDLKKEGVSLKIVEEQDLAESLNVASIVLVGADTVYEDGSLKNKIGTRPLARGRRAPASASSLRAGSSSSRRSTRPPRRTSPTFATPRRRT